MLPNSIDALLNEGLQLRQMPVETFAELARLESISGASKSKLFESFRDVKPLKNDVAERLWTLWQEIEAMCQAARPLKLSLADGEQVHDWLKQRRAGVLTIVIFENHDGADSKQ